jgi:hypothetical protein
VFVTKGFDGPATFKGDLLRISLKAKGYIPIKVVHPVQPKTPSGATYEERKKIYEEYREKLKKHHALLKKYGVSRYPTMVFMTSGGEVVYRLCFPNTSLVNRTLCDLGKIIKKYEEAKAKAEEEKKKREAAAAAAASAKAEAKAKSQPKK